MKFIHCQIFFLTLFFALFSIKTAAKNKYSLTNIPEIEKFVTDAKPFEKDTVKMKQYIGDLDVAKSYRSQIVADVLLAKAYDKVFDRRNDAADSLYRSAVGIAKKQKDRSMGVWAKMNFVYNRYFFRDYEQLIPVLLEVMNDLQSHANTQVLFPAETYKLIGWILQTMNDADESLFYLEKALNAAKVDTEEYASLLYSIGLHYFRNQEYERAMTYFNQTEKMALKMKDFSRYAKALGSKAEISEARNDLPLAIRLAEMDVKFSERTVDEQNTLYALVLLSRLYLKAKQPELAKSTIVRAEMIAYSKTYYSSAQRRIVLMKLELLNGRDASEELKLLKELKILEDTVRKKDGEIAVRNSQYQIQKRKYEIDLDNTKAAFRQRTNIFILICIVLLFAVSFIYWSYRSKLKNRILAYDNLILEMEVEKQRHELKLVETESSLKAQIEYLKNKNAQIRKINSEIQKMERSPAFNIEEKEGKLHALLESHLMTDENWMRFKAEFQKTYPDYFNTLLEDYPDLTDANLRIVLLQNLGFSYNETAALLGITSEAVRKSKQRMKKKYNQKSDAMFEKLMNI